MAVTLLPCPFCGGAAEFVRSGTSRQSCIVNCTECSASLESSDEGDSSGRTWNMRHADPDFARLRALGLEACDLAASYADDAREYGAPSPRIDEIRKELTR